MTNSQIFKAAHKLTRATILRSKGDSYSATFAICLKITIANAKKAAMPQGEYKNLGQAWGAFVKGVYNSKTKSVSRPAIGEQVCITTKNYNFIIPRLKTVSRIDFKPFKTSPFDIRSRLI